jgi:HD domain-containing protein
MVKKYNEYINESVYKDEFLVLYNKSPENLKDLIDQTKNVEQNPYWHPEGVVFIHTRLVTNRLSNCYNDIDQNLSGLFHDLGKIEKTKYDEDKETYTAHQHELSSVDIIDNFKDWIKEMGGNVDKIKYIVSNHMRYKYLNEMRIREQIRFMDDKYFSELEKFSTADYGGDGLDCKPIPDNKEIVDKINVFLKEEEENKIISSKFNGKMVMDKYPELKGKELGLALNGFKKKFDDFKWYALNTPSKDIMNDFDKFITNL